MEGLVLKVFVLGIGNTLEGDDGAGIYIVEEINRLLADTKNKQTERDIEITAIDCNTVPENYTSFIRKQRPDRVILVDAADMALDPGSYRIIPPEKISILNVTTHNMPLSFFITYISDYCHDIILIGIQPEKIEFGTTLSPIVQGNCAKLVELIIKQRLNEINPVEDN